MIFTCTSAMSRTWRSSSSSTMPDLIQTRFCIGPSHHVIGDDALGDRNKREADVTRVDAPLDLHDAFPDRQPVQKYFIATLQKERSLRCHNVVLVLQAQ